jgi:Methyltransferase small domain
MGPRNSPRCLAVFFWAQQAMRLQLSRDLRSVRYLSENGECLDVLRTPKTLHPDHIFRDRPRYPIRYEWRGVAIDYDDPEVFRPSLDSYLLSLRVIQLLESCGVRPRAILDLGAGTGIIGICIASALGAPRLILVDSCPRARESSRRNAARMTQRCEVTILDDAEGALRDHAVEFAVANPPYYREGSRSDPWMPGVHGKGVLPRWVNECLSRQVALAFVLPRTEAEPHWLLQDAQSGAVCSFGSAMVVKRHLLTQSERMVFTAGGQSDGVPLHAIDFLLCHQKLFFRNGSCSNCWESAEIGQSGMSVCRRACGTRALQPCIPRLLLTERGARSKAESTENREEFRCGVSETT